MSAPSGAGKSTLVAHVRRAFPDMRYSISCTTRSPRADETEGVHYHFLGKQQFRQMIEHDQFLEWKEVHGHLYGTPAEPVMKTLESGGRMILDIDVEGAREVFRKVDNAVGIFVSPPTMAVLEQRLRLRGTDSERSIRTRLVNAAKEMEAVSLFRYHIVNDDLGRAVDELMSIIRKESAAMG
ncbi:MAG: guanylate kinase [Deltaproteobacteria bacterium]